LTITTVGNDTYEERNAKVTIKAGATTQSFIITQKAAPAPDPDEEKGTGAEIESGGGIEEG
jgi:hypothetical protein